MLARAERQNAQDRKMLYEVDEALCRAVKDDAIKFVIIAAAGANFSGGHDIREQWSDGERQALGAFRLHARARRSSPRASI